VKRALFILGVVLLLAFIVIPGGAMAALTLKLNDSQKRVRRALRAAAVKYGLNPDYLDAIGHVEGPRWTLNARSTHPADEARGGAFGPTQITERTARGGGYTGPMQAFREDPELAAEWTARLLAAMHKSRPLVTLADYSAAWNAGKYDADKNNNDELEELHATHATRSSYLPKARLALAVVKVIPYT
jgi:soluble lytic murein transglycosylase-like protein